MAMDIRYAVQNTAGMRRRTFLRTSSLALAAVWSSRAFGAVTGNPVLSGYPFTLGVASGDPTADGFVIWTRLAPVPFEPGGGMLPEPVRVGWRIAEDEEMRQVVAQGDTVAVPDWAHSVHVEAHGLKPDRWYWYEFRVGNEISPRGRTRTTPADGQMPERLKFSFVSCQHYETGFYTAYKYIAEENPDLVVHLGDYIYESNKKEPVRPHRNKQVKTLEEYRSQYALYRTDPDLQRMHGLAPFITTWDDHEVKNNYAGGDDRSESDLALRSNAYKAYYEHMPLRLTSLPQGPDMQLYRRISYGALANFHVLDTRQYRTKQLEGKDAMKQALDPKGTILGDSQRKWLLDGLAGSATTWNVLAQQVPMARIDAKVGVGEGYSTDKWAGYEVDRRAVMRHLRERKITNAVVLTGDVHKNFANDLVDDFDQSQPMPVATEFIGTSVSSGGDGDEDKARSAEFMSENPFMKFANAERGYVSCEVTPKLWRTDYKALEYVSKPGAPCHTRASFAVDPAKPQLHIA